MRTKPWSLIAMLGVTLFVGAGCETMSMGSSPTAWYKAGYVTITMAGHVSKPGRYTVNPRGPAVFARLFRDAGGWDGQSERGGPANYVLVQRGGEAGQGGIGDDASRVQRIRVDLDVMQDPLTGTVSIRDKPGVAFSLHEGDVVYFP
jgi:hypothetical protein